MSSAASSISACILSYSCLNIHGSFPEDFILHFLSLEDIQYTQYLSYVSKQLYTRYRTCFTRYSNIATYYIIFDWISSTIILFCLPKSEELHHHSRFIMSFARTICKAMEKIAPLRLAEPWDNVSKKKIQSEKAPLVCNKLSSHMYYTGWPFVRFLLIS